MNITTTITTLNSLRSDMQQARKSLAETVRTNNNTLQPEFSKPKNEAAQSTAQAKIDRLAREAQTYINNAAKSLDDDISSKFDSTSFTADMGAELDALDKMKPTAAELQRYADKFKGSTLAMRRLDQVAREHGMKVTGPLVTELDKAKQDILGALQLIANDTINSGLEDNLTNRLSADKATQTAQLAMNDYSKLVAAPFIVTKLTAEDVAAGSAAAIQ